MAQRKSDQYKVVKGPKAKDSGVEASYEYLTGNEVSTSDSQQPKRQ